MKNEQLRETLEQLVTIERISGWISAIVILVLGIGLAMVLKRRLRIKALKPQHALLFQRSVTYLVLVLTVAAALRELGVDLGVLLGAAGIVTVAVGFAAQASISNLISGLFLMGEQPFVIGDLVTVGSVTGEVLSIDLMSVKIRTFDNLHVRVPNETMLKSNVTTVTKYPIRRVDMKMGVAYRSDLERVRDLLMELADRNPLCLTEPEPLFIFTGYGDNALEFQFSAWAASENFLSLRNGLYFEIKAAFDEAGIEIPFPQRTLSA
ncbi:MAG: mechanosensitive ion channel family protein, partial [Myxococcota bacterium]|nr:mechanosensitive ion channel family protein [Myxococcota bacterium]